MGCKAAFFRTAPKEKGDFRGICSIQMDFLFTRLDVRFLMMNIFDKHFWMKNLRIFEGFSVVELSR